MTAEPIRDAALRSLCAALEIQALVEEEFFYPAVRQFGVNSTDLPALSKSQEEHDHMRELIKSVRSLQGQRQTQDASVAKPVNAVMHHVADEETQPLALAERELEKERLAELGAQTTARKLELSRPRAAELATDMSAASPVKATLLAVGALVAGSIFLGSLRRTRNSER